jgi:hypothetical protein
MARRRPQSVWVPLVVPPLVSAANMKRAKSGQRPFPDDCLPKLRQQVIKSRTKWQLQRALCLLLRATFHLPAWQIGELIGWNTESVWRMAALYLRDGDAVFDAPSRGGRHHQLLSVDAEVRLLRAVRRESARDGYVDAAVVREAYEKALGRPVAPSTVYRMLARHGWLKAPVLQVPGPRPRRKTYFTKRLPPVEDK